jgi:hypothetical protein
MARIIYSGLVQAINGSIQGTTFQRNAYGHSIKVKPNMVNPNRVRQSFRKTSFNLVAQHWRTMTGANRSAWASYATNFPRPSRLNASSNLNGYNYYSAANNLRQLHSPGTFTDNPSGAQGTAIFNDLLVLYSGGNLTADIDVTVTGTVWWVILALTQRLGDGQEFVQPTPKVVLSALVAGLAPININAVYLSIFGSLPPIGSFIGYDLTLVKDNNGQIFEFGTGKVQVS